MANSYLSRTLGTSTNVYKGTVSHWIKRSNLGSMGTFAAWDNGGTASNRAYLNLYNDSLYFYDQPTSTIVQTNRLFRDTSAWYHIVVGWDTSQVTESDRVKIYVNGVQETSMATANYPSQNSTLQFNTSGRTFSVGSYASSGSAAGFFDGYQSHFAFVDGQQLTPTPFGITDSTSGIWKFITPSGVTWGTNGVHLKFENSGALGTDSSGNSNTFTVNGNLKQALDTPSNVYATLSNIVGASSTATYSNGNLTAAISSSKSTSSTLGASAGKFYFETKLNDAQNTYLGICSERNTGTKFGSYRPLTESVMVNTAGNIYNAGGSTGSKGLPSMVTNDIIGCAFDIDNGKIWWSKNGQWYSGNSNSSSTINISDVVAGNSAYDFSSWTGEFALGAFGTSTNANNISVNFGNGFFGTTAVSSNSGAGEQDDGGEGIFQYDVPTGYRALNTKNINTYG
ncbi:SPRY domain-containing protein [Hyphomonas sp.]|uniref:SPRY domain-containing protein n=1 Tax=Hyphomonas sp. TaxID=87 RepID=UPI000C92559A|nr:SPRY domain-containing protein [Hyphomonas sp.]MAL44586.1 hypothetical protein [Hyphomonas sp.]